MNFGLAIELMKAGYPVTREGWNGKGMFVYLVPKAEYPAQTGVAKHFWGEGCLVPYGAYFALRNAQGTVDVWQPSTPDCLADDWQLKQLKSELQLSSAMQCASETLYGASVKAGGPISA